MQLPHPVGWNKLLSVLNGKDKKSKIFKYGAKI